MEKLPKDFLSNERKNGNNTENNFLQSKTHRNKGKHSKHPNKKKVLLHQLEFYFSDVNLLNDKFLRNIINKDIDKGVDVNILLSFNKIKSIMKGIESDQEKINFIRNSVENSKKLKFNHNKVSRKEKFDLNKLNIKEIDKKTIYVENIPNDITHEGLYQIFSQNGKVLHVSIPKFAETKHNKGFAFIIFDKFEDAEKALEERNNTVPREIVSLSTLHSNTANLNPLMILSKRDWIKKKEEFKKLKQEMINENKDIFAECFSQDPKNMSTLTPGTLIKLSNLPTLKKIDKNEIKIWVSHFVEPAYVDYQTDRNQCIIRFSHKILADSFLNKVNNEEDYEFQNTRLTAELITGEEEMDYFDKVQKIKEGMRKKNK